MRSEAMSPSWPSLCIEHSQNAHLIMYYHTVTFCLFISTFNVQLSMYSVCLNQLNNGSGYRWPRSGEMVLPKKLRARITHAAKTCTTEGVVICNCY